MYDTKNKAGQVTGYTVTWMEGEDRKYKRLPRDKEAAKEFKREKERLETRHRLGLIDPKERKLQEAAALDIGSHLDVFVKFLASKGNKEASIETARTNCEKIFRLAKVRKLPDIDIDEITEALAGLRGPHRGGSNGSYNQRRISVRNFTNWCVRTGRLASDPLLDLPGLNEEEDRRRPKRTLTLDDLSRLIRSAHQGPKINFQSGPTRSLIYRLTVVTGMRYNEVKRMKVRDLRLDAEPPKIEVDAPHEKRGRDSRFTLTRAVAEELRAFVAGKAPTDRVFHRLPRIGTVLVYPDLERCDPPIPIRDDKGRVFDFHGLRAMHAIALDVAGAPLAVIVKSMRHSNPKITNRYLNAADSDVEQTIERLASFASLRSIGDHSGRFDAANGAASVIPASERISPQVVEATGDGVPAVVGCGPDESRTTITARSLLSPRPPAADDDHHHRNG